MKNRTCKACTMYKHGVKTRRAIPHTCGKDAPAQRPLFGFKDMLQRAKVPVSAERIKQVQSAIAAGDGITAVQGLRSIREALESYEQRLNNR